MKIVKSLLLFLLFPVLLHAQKFLSKSEIYTFFDNTEFAGSSYTRDQTMGGVSLGQMFGYNFDKNYYLVAGVNLSKDFGSKDILNGADFIAYFQYRKKNTLFKAGSFLRHDLLSDYSNFLFQDSVNYYKHVMDGLYLLQGNDRRYVKLWLDWTGLQSEVDRESFFIGVSARQPFAKDFFISFQSYLFHYAGTRPAQPGQYVCDNGLVQGSLGWERNHLGEWEKLSFSAGILAGFERNRKNMGDAYLPVGFVGGTAVQYKNFGMENLIYAGQSRMKFYNEFGNNLYWGNPFLRGNFYVQNKIYWNIFDTKYVRGRLASRHHFSEKKVFFEQLFTLSANVSK